MAYAARRSYAGAAPACTLTNAITSGDTSALLTGDVTNWNNTANGSFFMVIDPGLSTEEKVLVGSRSGSSLSSITRGADGTTATSHSAGATCYPVFTATDADQANKVASTLTTKGDILVTTGSVLDRLAVGTNDYALLADSSATNGVAWKQIPAAGIASDAVTTAKILDANVTAGKLASNAVETAKILDANVTGAKLANLTVSTKTGSYTLVAADRNTRVAMNSGSNTTITVNTSLFSAGDVVYIHNIGAGTCTVTAGTATVTTSGSLALAQWGGGTLYFTSASASIFFPYGGIGYGTATGGTSVTISGTNYQYVAITSTGSFTPTTAGLFDVLVLGAGGGGSGSNNTFPAIGGGGGGAGAIVQGTVYFAASAQTITVGAGGSGGNQATGTKGTYSNAGGVIAIGGGGGSRSTSGDTQQVGASGGGGGDGANQTTAYFGNGVYGYNGGSGVSVNGGGGGGGFSAVGASVASTLGGDGGAGSDVNTFIGGSSLFKAGGGGGGGQGGGGAGGSGVGGAGATSGAGSAAAANTASGGGGARGASSVLGGSGGSGIVYIRWKV